MGEPAAPLRILVTDDSPVLRSLLAQILGRDPRFLVVGGASNGRECLQAISTLHPEVVVLDVQMPVMDGMETLRRIRKRHPRVAVVMFTSQSAGDARLTIKALRLGAFDFVAKPEGGSIQGSLRAIESDLMAKLAVLYGSLRAEPTRPEAPPAAAAPQPAASHRPRRLIAVGVSTGGPPALIRLLPGLDPHLPAAVLIVQHMPPVFTRSLAQQLNEVCPLEVREAAAGDVVRPGLVLIAPGGRHMTVAAASPGDGAVVRLEHGPPLHGCRPSADVLFKSVARLYGPEAVALVMTGMGTDGTDGAMSMKGRGAYLMAQDRASCAVFGMPRRLVEENMCDAVLPLQAIAPHLNRLAGAAD